MAIHELKQSPFTKKGIDKFQSLPKPLQGGYTLQHGAFPKMHTPYSFRIAFISYQVNLFATWLEKSINHNNFVSTLKQVRIQGLF